jgi:hypothetical protein
MVVAPECALKSAFGQNQPSNSRMAKGAWAKRFACAISSTGSSSRAWCAAERRPTLITFGLSSLVRWAAVSVTDIALEGARRRGRDSAGPPRCLSRGYRTDLGTDVILGEMRGACRPPASPIDRARPEVGDQ